MNDAPTFNIPELDVRNIATTPVVGNTYKNYASTIRAYNFTISGSATRKLISKGTESFNQTSIASTIEEVESDCTTYDIFRAGMHNHRTLKKVVFNNLTQITSQQGNFVNGCTNPDLEIVFPNIKTLNGNPNISLFDSVCNVVIPKSAVRLTSRICHNNQTITLNCNKAIIDSIWCGSAPTINFTMCDDWQASINIAIAAANHTIDWFIDLFTNKLADMTGQDAPQINIPLAIFEALSPEQLTIAQNKNWTVTGS